MAILISDSFKIRESTSDEWEDILFSINSPGVPAGGQVDQFLVKNSNLNYDTKWATPNARYFFSLIWELIYPVGSYYWSSESTSPEVLFGGTWEQIQDTFLLAAGNTYTAGSTGGEAEHTLTVDEMPSHSHDKILSGGNGDWPICDNTGIGGAPYTYAHTVQVTGTTKENFADAAWTTNSKGGSQPHNNMPPYLVAYCWHRIA